MITAPLRKLLKFRHWSYGHYYWNQPICPWMRLWVSTSYSDSILNNQTTKEKFTKSKLFVLVITFQLIFRKRNGRPNKNMQGFAIMFQFVANTIYERFQRTLKYLKFADKHSYFFALAPWTLIAGTNSTTIGAKL